MVSEPRAASVSSGGYQLNSNSLLYSLFAVFLIISLFPTYLSAETTSDYYPISVSPENNKGSHAVASRSTQKALDKIDSETASANRNTSIRTDESHLISMEASEASIIKGDSSYPLNGFGVFKRELDLFRSQAFAADGVLHLDIPAKSQPEGNLLSQSDLYQELYFHAGLTGVRNFLFNNENASLDDEEVINNVLLELDQLLGDQAYQSTVDNLIDWRNDYVLSSAEQGEWTIWRFTPDLLPDDYIGNTITSTSPAQFSINDVHLTFPASNIHKLDSTSSHAGMWIMQNSQLSGDGCAIPEVDHRCVEYFAQTDLSATPKLYVESEASDFTNLNHGISLISEDWQALGAGVGTGNDQFAVRIREKHLLTGGNYQFVANADDAVRVWLNDQLIIDGWVTLDNSQPIRRLENELDIEDGEHVITIEYADLQDTAALGVWIKQLSCNNEENGQCMPEQAETEAPDVQTTSMRPQTSVTDSPEIAVEDDTETTETTPEPAEEKVTDAPEGDLCSVIPEGKFCAEFFAGKDLAADPIHQRLDESIDFYWKGKSPVEGVVSKDQFSVRWQGNFEFEAGTYRFVSATDDGIRIWVDDEEIITSWKNQGTTEYTKDIQLTQGKHLVKVEYYENHGWATAKLRWEPQSDCSGIPENQFCGSYYNLDRSFEGEPARTFLTDNINHEFVDQESPLHGVRHKKYSVSWVGQFTFPETAYYQFNSEADDGLRIWLDDVLITNAWKRRRPFDGKEQRIVKVEQGQHVVKVEYYQRSGAAKAMVNWELYEGCNTEETDNFCMEIFDHRKFNQLEGASVFPKYRETVDAINFDWQYGSPAEMIKPNNFSVRWLGKHEFQQGSYRFTAASDDGVRLFIDDELVLDQWRMRRFKSNEVIVDLDAGYHDIRMEYYEAWGKAAANLTWSKIPSCNTAELGQLCGMFFNSKNLSGSIVDVQMTDAINFDWGYESPSDRVRDNKFSARWVTKDNFGAGLQNFYAQADDRVRIFVDDELVFDKWERSSPDSDKELKAVELTEGVHEIRVEYAEKWGKATVNVSWEKRPPEPDTTPPSKPEGLKTVKTTADRVDLSWEPATDNVGVYQYEIWRDQVKVATTPETVHYDTGLDSFKSYIYQVIAIDVSGNRSEPSNAITVITQDGVAPNAPSGLMAQNINNGIELMWQPATDNAGVSGYKIWRNGELLTEVSDTYYVDTNVEEDQLYTYAITALDNAGNESGSSESIEIRTNDDQPPSQVINLRAVPEGEGVKLTWNASTDNTGIKDYRILRNDQIIAVSRLTEYADNNVEQGKSYYYQVIAIDESGNAAMPSDVVEVTVSQFCEAISDDFVSTVEPSLMVCSSCHSSTSIAQNTRFVLNMGNSSENLSVLNNINEEIGKTVILNKVSGQQSHGGGTIYNVASEQYQQLSDFLDRLDNPQDCGNEPEPEDRNAISVSSMAATCSSCHGTEGASMGPATPTISGLSSQYLYKVLKDYKSNMRASTVMNRIATGYTDEQLQSVADYFAEQPHHVEPQSFDEELATLGEQLHQTNCSSCHGNAGKDATITGTRLAGQFKPYMQRTLQDYVAGNSVAPQAMLSLLQNIYQQEGQTGIDALVEYYASSGTDTQPPSTPEGIELASISIDSVTFSWMDSDDDWSPAYYEIYRDLEPIAITEHAVFTDKDLEPGEYSYTIVAVDSAGNRSPQSETLNITISSDIVVRNGLVLLDYPESLRKASLILLGRLPTAEETYSVTDEASFRLTLRSMMDGEGALDDFIYRGGHEIFLSRGAASPGSGTGIHPIDFPSWDLLSDDERRVVRDTMRAEPTNLLQYIVANDLPWTEALTADYTVLNAASAKAVDAEPIMGSFIDTLNREQKLPVKLPRLSVRFPDKPFPHAGVLTTNAWLSRFPTTDTNRNRHRASEVYKQFFGIDIESLAQRPIDDSENIDFVVPTMEDPNCTVCHTVMEPVAGAFKNWGTSNRYKQSFNGENSVFDSLAGAYRSSSYARDHDNQRWYQSGDTWYRDMFKPGYGDKEMPGGHHDFMDTNWDISRNLLTNPGAESGEAGWQVVQGSLQSVNAENCDRALEPLRGNMFKLGDCTAELDATTVIQSVDISDSSTAIDNGEASVRYGAYIRTLRSRDRPTFWVDFQDASGNSLGTSAQQTSLRSSYWQNMTQELAIPTGTRQLVMTISAQRGGSASDDPYIDAFIDDIYLKLKKPSDNVRDIAGATDGLQWLGRALVDDPRFAKGTVYFWYRALFKRQPLELPLDENALDYEKRVAAYNEQNAIFERLAGDLVQDRGNGTWNVKDLLVDMVVAPLFRAYEKDDESVASADMGITRLLAPEELNRKIMAVTGIDWINFRDDRVWSNRMSVFYGGFDGGNLQLQINPEMNTLMSKIPDRMAIELSCNAVYNEFNLEAGDRRLFPHVETTDIPAFTDVDIGENNLLVNPGAEEDMLGWVIETGTARILSGPRGCEGGPSIKSGFKIFNPGSICSNQTELGRIYQEVDVSQWAQWIDEGEARTLFGAALRGWSTDNDEASAYLTFHQADGTEISQSESLYGAWSSWKSIYDTIDIPAQTRSIRFHLQGRRLSDHPNNDAFADDTYLRVVLPGNLIQTQGEKNIRKNIQYLYKLMLDEEVALDSPEIDTAYRLFSEIQADNTEENNTCRLYSEWEDPDFTQRSWSVVLMYFMTDAKFLYE